MKYHLAPQLGELYLRKAKLAGFGILAATDALIRRIDLSIKHLRQLDGDAYKLLLLRTKGLVWVKPTVSEAGSFASSTFTHPYGITFLTRLAFRFVPPNIVLPINTTYALAENLVHEALHQHLYFALDKYGFIMQEFRGLDGPEIFVPWRKTCWKLEHAFHAYYVYVHLYLLRRRAAQEMEFFGALEKALEAATTLQAGVEQHRSCFSKEGNDFLRNIKRSLRQGNPWAYRID